MPFGVKNAGACFQKKMDDALVKHTNVKCYIDDVLIYSKTFAEHLRHVEGVFRMIVAVGLKAHPSKCVFGAREVPYLGHVLSADGAIPMEAKVKTITAMPAPTDVSGARWFMGLAGYHRKFVLNFSSLAKPRRGHTHRLFGQTHDRKRSRARRML